MIHPYLILLVLVASCVCAFFAIKKPAISILMLVSTFAFFLIIALPYSIEAAVVGFSSPWIGGSVGSYQIGFSLMGYGSYLIYTDIAFTIYAIVTALLRRSQWCNL